MTDQPRTHSFQTPGPTRLRVEVPQGRIRILADAEGETRVELHAPHGDSAALQWIAEAEVADVGGEIVVRNPNRRLFFGLTHCGPIEATVHAPAGSAGHLSIGAGRIETSGKLGELTASSGAGNIHVEACAAARVRTGSGNIDVVEAAGEVDATTGAGTVAIGKAGDVRITTGAGNARLEAVAGSARLTTGHGNVDVGQAGDSVEAFTASGNIEVRRADHGRVRAKTVSGRVRVGVAEGVAALLDLHSISGRVRSELGASGPPAAGEKHVELILSTVSGNVNVSRA
jgi:hypothetical protein